MVKRGSKAVSFRLKGETVKVLEGIKGETGMSQTAIIERAVEMYGTHYGENRVVVSYPAPLVGESPAAEQVEKPTLSLEANGALESGEATFVVPEQLISLASYAFEDVRLQPRTGKKPLLRPSEKGKKR